MGGPLPFSIGITQGQRFVKGFFFWFFKTIKGWEIVQINKPNFGPLVKSSISRGIRRHSGNDKHTKGVFAIMEPKILDEKTKIIDKYNKKILTKINITCKKKKI